MVYANDIIEPSGLFISNIITKSTEDKKNIWQQGFESSYAFTSFTYNPCLVPGNYYWLGYDVKYTTTKDNPKSFFAVLQGGAGGGRLIVDPLPNTEYHKSRLDRCSHDYLNLVLTVGNLYTAPPYSGVIGYYKNLYCYDVTELRQILIATKTAITNLDIIDWCESNIGYHNFEEKVFLGDKFTSLDKTYLNDGNIIADNIVETDGLTSTRYTSTMTKDTWFDTNLKVLSIYNNLGNGSVTHAIVSAKELNSPFFNEHPNVLKITTNGTASPCAGGFVATHIASANKIILETFIAKVPIGYSIVPAWNSQGSGALVLVINSGGGLGTGDWKEYKILYKCGSSGLFLNGGHVYLSGSDNTSVTWYVAHWNSCDITNDIDLQGILTMPNLFAIKSGKIMAKDFNERSLFIDGLLLNSQLPTNAILDYDDIPEGSNAFCSIVLPVGKGIGCFGKIPVDSSCKYKVSYWVKCQRDMKLFLTSVQYYKDDTIIPIYSHSYVGVPAQLIQELKAGDTIVHLSTVNGWTTSSLDLLQFRSGGIWGMSPYADLGWYWNQGGNGIGTIASIDNDNKTITLAKPYDGETLPVNTVVTNGRASATYRYVVTRSDLPKNNEWKYVEGYFGTEGLTSNGLNNYYYSTDNKMPCNVNYVRLCMNIYSNDGTVPIKYADIKIEPVGDRDAHNKDKKISISQLKK